MLWIPLIALFIWAQAPNGIFVPNSSKTSLLHSTLLPYPECSIICSQFALSAWFIRKVLNRLKLHKTTLPKYFALALHSFLERTESGILWTCLAHFILCQRVSAKMELIISPFSHERCFLNFNATGFLWLPPQSLRCLQERFFYTMQLNQNCGVLLKSVQ